MRKGKLLGLTLVAVLSVSLVLPLRIPTAAGTPASTKLQRNDSARAIKVAKVPGRKRMLVIGNVKYKNVGDLETAANDAREFFELMKLDYGFEGKLLINATRNEILDAIYELRNTLEENDSCIVYYAGHGMFDQEVNKAYWIPVDADPKTNALWISQDDVTTNLKGIRARHILLISDSCFGGMISRQINPNDWQDYEDRMMEEHSRKLMASGGNEPVADGGGSGHSVFAASLLNGLKEIKKIKFCAEELFQRYILKQVKDGTDQTPQYAPIKNSGHLGGDFIFVRTKTSTSLPVPASPCPDKETADLSYNLAVAKMNQGKYIDAETNFREVIKCLPNNLNAFYNLAVCEMNQGKHREAIVTFNKVIALDPDVQMKAKAFYNLGVCFQNLGEHKNATEYFERAQNLKKNNR